jgi:hypothetical protein
MTQNTHKFWVVTRPTSVSTLGDILFETDAKGLILQARGGLKAEEILLTTSDADEAWIAATLALWRKPALHQEFRIYVGADGQEHGEY